MPPPTFRSCKRNLCSSCFMICWTLAVSACRLYRSLAASSLATCSCRSLCFTLSNCQGPRFLGIGVTGSAKGKKWKNAGAAGEGIWRRRDGQKGRFSKMCGGGEVLWAKRVAYEVENGSKMRIWNVPRLAQQTKPIHNYLNVTMLINMSFISRKFYKWLSFCMFHT